MVFAGAVAAVVLTVAAPHPGAESSEPPAEPATTVDNVYLPEDADVNVTDCVSAAPRPECGSKERGGWRQYAVFGAMAGGLALIGTRIVMQMNRHRRDSDSVA